MNHLVQPFGHVSMPQALERLREAHGFLVARGKLSALVSSANESWGIDNKRHRVSLEKLDRPEDIGKESERLPELINMTATIERLIGTLDWAATQPDLRDAIVSECHPTTSDEPEANDLVLAEPANGRTLALFEVCDVASRSDGNKKERKSLAKLGCSEAVPEDGIRRFIGVSQDFAELLLSPRRRARAYAYRAHAANDGLGTTLLEVVFDLAGNA